MSGSDGSGVRTRFTQLPGVSFIAIATQVGPTRGIEIDNPSGSWLYIPSLETFIPPYTTGWTFGFPYDVASLDVLSRDRQPNGPAGQISTLAGDAVTIYLTDLQLERKTGEPSGNAAGAPSAGSPTSDQNFITQFTPLLSAFGTPGLVKVSVGGSVTIVPAIPAKRFRVFQWTVTRGVPTGAGSTNGSDIYCTLDDTTHSLDAMQLRWYDNEKSHPLQPGLDFVVGEPIIITFFPTGWADVNQPFVSVDYSII